MATNSPKHFFLLHRMKNMQTSPNMELEKAVKEAKKGLLFVQLTWNIVILILKIASWLKSTNEMEMISVNFFKVTHLLGLNIRIC